MRADGNIGTDDDPSHAGGPGFESLRATIHISELQVPQSVGGSVCDVDCDVTAQFTFPTAG